jgi:hypothetical protein
VIAKYYTQIRTPRLAELLDLSADEVGALPSPLPACATAYPAP